MNILYVLNSGKNGGMEQHVLDLVRGMSSLHCNVFVWCPEGDMQEKFRAAGASVYTEKCMWDIDPKFILRLKKFLKNNHIQIIHMHEPKSVFNGLVAAFLANVRVRISHTHTPISTWRVGKIRKFMGVIMYSLFVNYLSTKEIALTETAKKLKELEGIKKNKLVVIPNGLDTSEFTVSYNDKLEFREKIRNKYRIPQTDFVFGCLGRLTKEKGHFLLLDAFKKFLNSDLLSKWNFHLLIVGGGILEKDLKDYARKLEIEDRVVITGVFERSETVKFYSSFDLFVFPSFTEGFGFVLIEAMFTQTPVLCSDLNVLQDVGGNTVSYFKTGSSDDLARKMSDMYKNIISDDDIKLERARERVEEEFSMNRFVDNYTKLYESEL